jgi:hypothetical protein
MGVCDYKRGECTCADGYEGAACERISCAGSHDPTVSTCANNGRCLSLRDMGNSRVDFYGDPEALIYGQNVGDSKTWDADMIYGCKADAYGYYHDTITSNTAYLPQAYGYNADRYSCPKSYNPRALEVGIYNSTNGSLAYNVQHLLCTATNGHFQLSFRGEYTSIIQHNDSVAQLEAALEELSTIGEVDVEILYGGSVYGAVCDQTTDTTVIITFVTELGPIPTVKVSNNALYPPSSISIFAVTSESALLYECGGRGECNRLTGQCICWDHWSTSNGFGEDGILGDCGSNQIT